MPHIFISYSRRDAAYVDRVIAGIRVAGYPVWLDRKGIRAGDQWRREIVEAIQSARVFILVLSPNAARSENVRKELDLAEGGRVRVLPVVIAPTEVPAHMKYQLAGVHLLPLWRDEGRGIAALVRALGGYDLKQTRSGVPSPEAPPAKREPEIDLSHLGGGLIAGWLGRLKN